MNRRELRELLAEGESDRLQFKKSAGQRTETAKSVCAIPNGLGGFVFFGVTHKGGVGGQLVATNTLEDIAAELRRIEPPCVSRHLALRGSIPLDQVMSGDPIDKLYKNVHVLFDGYGSRPLYDEWDYEDTERRVLSTVIAEIKRDAPHGKLRT